MEITSYSEDLLTLDPSTGERIANSFINQKDFDNLVESSKSAFINWSNFTPLKRSRIISKFKELIEKNINELAELASSEHGKTLEDAKGSVIRGLEVVEWPGIPHF